MTEDSDIRGGKTWVPVGENPRFSGEAPSPDTITKLLPLPQQPGKRAYTHICLCVKYVHVKLKSWF